MKRPDLEALIWQNVPALTTGRPESRVRAMDQILAACDSYAHAIAALSLGEIDAYRRRRPETVHRLDSSPFRKGRSLCGLEPKPGRAITTALPEVTCTRCNPALRVAS